MAMVDEVVEIDEELMQVQYSGSDLVQNMS